MTLHTGVGLDFGNKHSSLSDKKRELKRDQFKNLKCLVTDEFSMILIFKYFKNMNYITISTMPSISTMSSLSTMSSMSNMSTMSIMSTLSTMSTMSTMSTIPTI